MEPRAVAVKFSHKTNFGDSFDKTNKQTNNKPRFFNLIFQEDLNFCPSKHQSRVLEKLFISYSSFDYCSYRQG